MELVLNIYVFGLVIAGPLSFLVAVGWLIKAAKEPPTVDFELVCSILGIAFVATMVWPAFLIVLSIYMLVKNVERQTKKS